MSVPWPHSEPSEPGDPGAVRNLPTDEGRMLGVEVARLADIEEAKRPDVLPRCNDCAFRSGTDPNGSAATLMDALKCAVEGTPFYCHKAKDGERLCSGYVLMVEAT